MKNYPFLESKCGKFVFGAFLFVLFLLARDTLITSCLLGFNQSQFLMLGMVGILGLAFLICNRRCLRELLTDPRVLLAAGTAAVVLVPMLAKSDWQMMYFSILFCPLFAVFLTFFRSLRDVSKWYVTILAFLCVYSLLATYVLKYLAFYGKISAPIFYNSSGWDFYNFGLSFAVTWEFWVRNFGIFREPGVYQFFLLLGLYLNNYTLDWKKSWQLWLINGILTLTMISTFAIGGYIELFLFVIFLYFDKKWYKDKRGKMLGILTVILGVCVLIFLTVKLMAPDVESTVYYVFYDMIIRLTSGSDSLIDRLDAIFTNLGFVFKNPLVGNAIAEVLHGTNHNTSSTLILYAIFGVLGGSFNVAAWIALFWKKNRNLFGNLFLMMILFMSFNTQNLVANAFFWLFPMMALVERGLPLCKLPRKKE